MQADQGIDVPEAIAPDGQAFEPHSSDAWPGLSALCLLARLHQVGADPAHLAHRLGWPPSHRPGPDDLKLAAKLIGLKAKRVRTSVERLALMPLPALALLKDGSGAPRAVVLAQCDGHRVLCQDPTGAIQGGRPVIEPLSVFAAQWAGPNGAGDLILVASRASLAGELARFDFSWFVPSLVKYRKLFGEVLLVSLFLQLFALVSPLFFQVVMDKVLVHHGLTTLDVLVVGLLVVVVFESVLTTLRTYVMGRGRGAERVQENDSTAGNTDLMQFMAGVATDQIWFRHIGSDLEVSIIGTADRATVQNWYSGSPYHVEQFKTSDGKTLLDSKVQDLVSAMASFTPPAMGQTALPANYQATLSPIIAADWGP
ncbi:MAG: calcium-binding protein [Burkholderiaceae bacterium]